MIVSMHAHSMLSRLCALCESIERIFKVIILNNTYNITVEPDYVAPIRLAMFYGEKSDQ